MSQSFIFQTERPWPNERLRIAAIVGHTTATSTRLWLRTGKPGDFTLLVYPEAADPDGAVFQGFKAVPYRALPKLPAAVTRVPVPIADWRSDSTTVVELTDLRPGTVYRYALYGAEEDRIMLGQDRRHRFRTLPEAPGPYSFALYSCHMPYEVSLFDKTNVVNMEMWDCFGAVLERHFADDLRFVIAGGDQVYTDGVATLDIWRYLDGNMRREGKRLLPSKADMISWYRDIYRGYWGFSGVRRVFSSFPIYMIWDDHELGDGWGSYYFQKSKKKNDLRRVLPSLDEPEKGLSEADGHELIRRMGEAGKQVYLEYQHGHNPKTKAGSWDYAYELGSSAFYILDGRGHRDVNRDAYRILGKPQLDRFVAWVDGLDPARTRYLFVVAAVPLIHLSAALVNRDLNMLVQKMGLSDDLRDSWEHRIHDKERRELLGALFRAAERGIRVSILSGDVHTSAVFRVVNPKTGKVLYQLTSSAITYNIARPLGWVLGAGVPDQGDTTEGYRFERIALYTDSSFAVIKVDPERDRVTFQLYGEQSVQAPDDIDLDRIERADLPITHAIAKIPLEF